MYRCSVTRGKLQTPGNAEEHRCSVVVGLSQASSMEVFHCNLPMPEILCKMGNQEVYTCTFPACQMIFTFVLLCRSGMPFPLNQTLSRLLPRRLRSLPLSVPMTIKSSRPRPCRTPYRQEMRKLLSFR